MNRPVPLDEKPRVARLVDVVDTAAFVDEGSGSGSGDDEAVAARVAAPVYAGHCLPITCDQGERPRWARAVDVVATPGEPPKPVYLIPPPDCCAGDKELVETECFGVASKEIHVVFGPDSNSQHCGTPGCKLVTLTYDEGSATWKGGSAVFTGGEVALELSCADKGGGSHQWKLEGTGCGAFTSYDTGACATSVMLSGFNLEIGNGCCDYPSLSPTASYFAFGACSPVRTGRYVGHEAVGSGDSLPVYMVSKCCANLFDAAPNCCDRLPHTMVATLSGLACLEGLAVTLTPSGAGWAGSEASDCGTIHVALFCSRFPVSPTCLEDSKVCPAQGHADCDRRTYQGGHFHATVTCGDAGDPSAFGGGDTCDVCDCDEEGEPVDFSLDAVVQQAEVPGACPDFGAIVGDSKIITVHVTQ